MPTSLSPLEEALFQTWTRAHGVDNHDDPNNQFDHRGLYKQTNGLIMPGHVVRQMADSHNKAMEPDAEAGGSMEFPDPYAAQAEIQGHQIKAQTDMKREAMKGELEKQKHQNKIQLEQMKLQHQSAEKDKDRAHKAQEQQMQRQQAAEDAERNRQQAAQDMQTQRQYQVEDQQASQQHDMHSTLMQEELARSRPQPAPSQGMPNQAQTPMGDGMPQPGGHDQGQGGGGLEHQLMNRQQPAQQSQGF